MSKITKRALISSLIASAVVAPAIAQRIVPQRFAPIGEHAKRVCGHDAADTIGARAVPASELLADGVVHGKVLTYLRRAFAASPEEAEDASQEAVVRALQKEIRSCCSTTFCGWMRRTSQNVLFDMRKKRRETRLSPEPEKMDSMIGPSSENGPGDMLAIRDDLDKILGHHDVVLQAHAESLVRNIDAGFNRQHATGGERYVGISHVVDVQPQRVAEAVHEIFFAGRFVGILLLYLGRLDQT